MALGGRDRTADGSSDEDAAPEVVGLSTGKVVALTQLKAHKDAAAAVEDQRRERRRGQDVLFKAQADSRRAKVALALAELGARGAAHASETLAIAPPKRVLIGGARGDGGSDQPKDIDVGPGKKVVVLTEKRVLRANLKVAHAAACTREGMLAAASLRRRVHTSATTAPARKGLPASRFALRHKDRQELLHKLSQPLPAAKSTQ